METKDILIFAFVFLALGIRLYLNYMKKKKKGTGLNGVKTTGSGGKLSGMPDDYEPYSKT